jgi:hypothetical protein
LFENPTIDKASPDYKQITLELQDKVDEVINKLQHIGSARDNLTDFRSLLKPGSKGGPYSSIIQQIISAVFDEKRQDVKDLEKLASASIGTLFTRSIFGGAKAKSKPTDNNTIIVFVVGGVTFSEIREIKEILAAMRVKQQVTRK